MMILAKRRGVLTGTAAFLAAMISRMSGVRAQPANFPNGPLHLVVPFAAGGITDIVARVVADRLSVKIGKPVIVENRAGAGARIAYEYVMGQPADGQTVLVVTSGKLSIGSLYDKLQFDPLKDFMTFVLVATTPVVLTVAPSLHVTTLAALREKLATPGHYSYGSAGIGISGHIYGAGFCKLLAVDATHVPYRGEELAMQDVAAGRITFTFGGVASSLPLIRAGKLVPICMVGDQRVPDLPDVPTIAEAGMPAFTDVFPTAPPNAFDLRAGTPKPIVDYLNQQVLAVLDEPGVKKKFADLQLSAFPRLDAAGSDAFMVNAAAKMTPIVKSLGVHLD